MCFSLRAAILRSGSRNDNDICGSILCGSQQLCVADLATEHVGPVARGAPPRLAQILSSHPFVLVPILRPRSYDGSDLRDVVDPSSSVLPLVLGPMALTWNPCHQRDIADPSSSVLSFVLVLGPMALTMIMHGIHATNVISRILPTLRPWSYGSPTDCMLQALP